MIKKHGYLMIDYCQETFIDLLLVILKDVLAKNQMGVYFGLFESKLRPTLENVIPGTITVKWPYLTYWDEILNIYIPNIRSHRIQADIIMISDLMGSFMKELTAGPTKCYSRYINSFTQPSATCKYKRRMYNNTDEVMEFIDNLKY